MTWDFTPLPMTTSKWDRRTRQLVHAHGLRYLTQHGIPYRRHSRTGMPICVTPDLYFRRLRLAVFLDGCYWHGCPECRPGRNGERYDRDRRSDAVLAGKGYTVLRIWEHEGAEEAARRIIAACMPRRIQVHGQGLAASTCVPRTHLNE